MLVIERNEHFGVAADGRRKYVLVLWIARHPLNQGFVSSHLRVWERTSHLSEPMSDLFGRQTTLQQVPFQLFHHPGRPQRPVGTCLGQAEHGVAQIGAKQDVSINERRKNHPPNLLPFGRRASSRCLVQPSSLTLLLHALQ